MKKTDGFTLLELVVGIFCAALITGAAMSLLLMGARTNRSLSDANSEQQTVRILTSLVDTMASEGDIRNLKIGNVIIDPDDPEQANKIEDLNNDGSLPWALLDRYGETILSYDPGADTISLQNSVLMEGVTSSLLTLSPGALNGTLLGFSVGTEDNTYETSVCCRMFTADGLILDRDQDEGKDTITAVDGTTNPSVDSDVLSDGRFQFLAKLCSQYGSTGYVLNFDSTSRVYFSEWYLDAKHEASYDTYPGNWNKDTPWCGCFISWGISNISEYLTETPYYASVDNPNTPAVDSWKEYIGTLTDPSFPPEAGDLIFFDWGNDGSLEHIGVVFNADDQFVYTIEGNNSDRVELNRYPLDSAEIEGYGVLPWA